MKDLGITKGEWRIRLFPDGDDFFVEAPNLNKPQLGYGIEIMQDDFGEHNGYPREQRLADAILIADAGNVAQKCGLLPSELLKQRDDAVDKVETLVGYLSIMALGKTPPELEAVIKEANEWIEITKAEER